MTDPQETSESAKAKFRRTLFQVLVVQAVALILLGLLQYRYHI